MADLKPKKRNVILDYFEESYQELKKVSWPTRNQAVKLTILVLAFCLISAVVIGALDALFSYGHQELINLGPQGTQETAAAETPVTAEAQPVSAEAPVGSVTVNGNSQPVTVTPQAPAATATGGTQATN